jgi:hypothetical protein
VPTVAEPLARSPLFRTLDSAVASLRQMDDSSTVSPNGAASSVRNLEDAIAFCRTLPGLIERLCESIASDAAHGRFAEAGQPVVAAQLRSFFENCGALFDGLGQEAATLIAQGFPIAGAEELVEAHRQIEESRRRLLEAHPDLDAPPPPSGLSYQDLRRAAEHNPPPPEWFAEDLDLLG